MYLSEVNTFNVLMLGLTKTIKIQCAPPKKINTSDEPFEVRIVTLVGKQYEKFLKVQRHGGSAHLCICQDVSLWHTSFKRLGGTAQLCICQVFIALAYEFRK